MPFLKTLIVSVCRWPLRPTGVAHHSSLLLAKQSSRRLARPANSVLPLISLWCGFTAGATASATTGVTTSVMAGATASVMASATAGATSTAARLRFQKRRDVADSVSDAGSVDALERAANVQPPFVLQRFHAAPADGGVHVLIDPRPRDRRHLGQIDMAADGAHTGRPSPCLPGVAP